MDARAGRPFARFRVLDLTDGVAGPYATRLLAGYGFDVVKVERPGTGDWARAAGPFPPGRPHSEMSGLFLYLNTGKRGITLDWETATGRHLLARLAEHADVIVESLGPGVATGIGLDYERLAASRPGLVMTSVSPFGQTGPKKDYRAPEIVLQAVSGFLYRNGQREREPLLEWGYQAQFIGGTNVLCGTLAALLGARLKGTGQYVDVSIQEAVIQFLGSTLLKWEFERQIVGRAPNSTLAAGGLMPTADGEIMMVTGGAGKGWRLLVDIIGDPRLKDEKFATQQGRAEHADELDAIIIAWLLEHRAEEIYHLLQSRGVPAGYLRTPAEIVSLPHHRERSFIQMYEHPVLGELPIPGSPFILEKVPWTCRRAPMLGEHTTEVLHELLGVTPDNVERLRKQGVV